MTTPMKTRQRELGGFSMIELMTVLVLIGIGASMVGPSFGTYMERSQTRRALDRVVGDVTYARMQAVQQGRRTAVNFQSDGSYTIDALATDGNWSTIRTIRLRDDYGGVTVSGATTLEFDSRGLLGNHSSEAFVVVGRNAIQDTVFISTVGRLYRGF